MKKDDSALISGSGRGTKVKITAAIGVIFAVLLTAASLAAELYGPETLEDYTIDQVYFKFKNKTGNIKTTGYQSLLHFKRGDPFNYKHIRKSMENLYKTGSFDNIETKIRKKPGGKLDVYFFFANKYLIQAIKIRELKKTDTLKLIPLGTTPTRFKKRELKNAVFSLREGTYFEEDNVTGAVEDIKKFLNSRGFFNPRVTYKIIKNNRRFTVTIKIFTRTGKHTIVNNIDLTVGRPELLEKINGLLRTRLYIPYKFNEKIEKVKQFLKEQKYHFPEITLGENFLDPSKSLVNLKITVEPGLRYIFKFKGMEDKINLISSIWEKKVFEKWAEKESKARIIYYLKNKGYLDAEVESKIVEKGNVKTITFFVRKKKKYKLGKIHFQGSESVPGKKLREVIKSDDLVYDKFFHLRLRSLLVDREILRLFYYFQGFPSAKIFIQPDFQGKKANISFVVNEGKKFTVDTILFEDNRFFTRQSLLSFLETREKDPFVQQKLNEDIEKLKNIYHTYGFDKIEITPEISPGTEKLILIRLREGESYRMGNLIIIGVSNSQRKLIKKLFPLDKDAPYDQIKIDAFKSDIENSSIFNRFKIAKIEKETGVIDVLIDANPHSSRYYGFGIGWEARRGLWRGLRGTLEYQGRNIFKSYSSLSAMVQLGPKEQRGVLSYDTPYFLKSRINSSLKLWADNEIYPSYEFNRFGIGESLIKKLTPKSYILASMSWYRTWLTQLEISPQGVDQLDVPFDTTALNFSYVRENRDDPFNPREGSFFSSNLKIGLPVFEKDYSFIKFRWSFQKNFKILKNGTFAASVRSGFASGDMSITERFFAGGPNSFRGTRTDRLSPVDPLTERPKGGNALLLFNLEATFPISIIPIDDLYYSIYADIGNVYEKVDDFNLKGLKKAVGLSIKWKTPMGPLWGGVVWNLEKKPEGNYFLIVMGIGNVF